MFLSQIAQLWQPDLAVITGGLFADFALTGSRKSRITLAETLTWRADEAVLQNGWSDRQWCPA